MENIVRQNWEQKKKTWKIYITRAVERRSESDECTLYVLNSKEETASFLGLLIYYAWFDLYLI